MRLRETITRPESGVFWRVEGDDRKPGCRKGDGVLPQHRSSQQCGKVKPRGQEESSGFLPSCQQLCMGRKRGKDQEREPQPRSARVTQSHCSPGDNQVQTRVARHWACTPAPPRKGEQAEAHGLSAWHRLCLATSTKPPLGTEGLWSWLTDSALALKDSVLSWRGHL